MPKSRGHQDSSIPGKYGFSQEFYIADFSATFLVILVLPSPCYRSRSIIIIAIIPQIATKLQFAVLGRIIESI